MTDERPTFLTRLARRPFPIFLGLAAGFLGCCVAGRVAARQQPYESFQRFHIGIAPESHYYPTYSQTLNLARAHVKPGKTLVVIGGSSVLYGSGQRGTHVWTRRLQELLGDDYVVLNLAMRAGWPNEFSGLIIEQLVAEGVPLVAVVSGAEFIGWGSSWDGYFYRYLFWDAWGKGLLQPEPRREAWLQDGFYETFEKQQPADAKARRQLAEARDKALEMRRRGLIDGVTYSSDLWHYLGYRYCGTVWTMFRAKDFWKPHRKFPDTEPGELVPWELSHNPAQDEVHLRILRGVNEYGTNLELHKGKYDHVANQYKTFLPEAIRDRVLFVLRMEGAYYRNRLRPDERAVYEDMFFRISDAVRGVGMNTVVVGQNYGERDYADRSHFNESGGRKLAEDVAPQVRALKEKLYGAKPDAANGEKP